MGQIPNIKAYLVGDGGYRTLAPSLILLIIVQLENGLDEVLGESVLELRRSNKNYTVQFKLDYLPITLLRIIGQESLGIKNQH